LYYSIVLYDIVTLKWTREIANGSNCGC